MVRMLDVVEPKTRPTAQATQPLAVALPPSLKEALERLLLANQIRELADFPRPVKVTELPQVDGVIARVARRVYASGRPLPRFNPSALSVLKHVALDACVLIWLRVWLTRGRMWRVARTTLGAIVRNAVFYRARYHALPPSEITGYVTASELERPLIRVCLLLHTMKRYGACIGLLIRRLRSGLPADETRRWLAFFLREASDVDAADRLAPMPGRREQPEGLVPSIRAPARLKYGMIILTMFDSDVFRSSLLSVLRSDFAGEVVVVEDGKQRAGACEAFCRSLPVTYVKNPTWTGPAGATNLGLEHLPPDTAVAILAHSDVLWPPRWFEPFNRAWEQVYDTKKVGLLSLGHMQVHASTDAILKELFVQGRYEELAWVLTKRRDVSPPLDHFLSIQNADPGLLFGLGREVWNDRPAQLRQMAGRFSVGASFTMDDWRTLGTFHPDMPYASDTDLQFHVCRARKWNLWVTTTPLIHLVSSDTGRLVGEDRCRNIERMQESYAGFTEKNGWDYDHFCWTYFAETCVIYHDEIVNAVNEMRFDDVDFIFDDLFQRLKRKKLSTCELVWCHSRASCQYV